MNHSASSVAPRHLIVNVISEGIAHCRQVCVCGSGGVGMSLEGSSSVSIVELMGTGCLGFVELIWESCRCILCACMVTRRDH